MIFAFDEFELDDQLRQLRSSGAEVRVQPKVMDLLLLLVRDRQRALSRQEMLERVWPGVVVGEASISRAIMDARKAIGDELHQRIVTVRAHGFRFAGPVEERGAAAAAAPRLGTPGVDRSFVGRDTCMAVLEARFEEAATGRGSVVWLSGEPGIGKTRTADEFARRCRAKGALVCVARASEDGGAPALWSWTQIARALDSTALAERLSAAAGARDAASSATSRFATFDAIVRELAARARSQPLVLVLDDLQWADDASLALLQFLIRNLHEIPIVIVGTFRDTDASGGGRAATLAGLASEYASHTIPLRGLAREEIPRFIEVTTGSVSTPAFADALLARSGGNPLFLQRLLQSDWGVRSLEGAAQELATSMDLQQGLIDSIAHHVGSMSDGARALLTESAILGRQFDLAKLAVVSAQDPHDLLDRLEEAVRARVLRKSAEGVFRFAHPLVRDVLYKKLGAGDRAAWHLRVGERLLAHYGGAADAHAAELAHHFGRALPNGDPARAVAFAIRAAEEQTALGAHDLAIKHWSEALRVASFLHGRAPQRLAAQLGLGRALARVGRGAEASAAFLDATVMARTFGSAEDLKEAELGYRSASTSAAPATSSPPNPSPPDVSLPPRIRETFEHLMTGASDKEIAERLGLSIHTVREYVKTVLKSFGVGSRAQLIARCAPPTRPPSDTR